MYCPHKVKLNTRYIYIVRHEKGDYHCGTPWKQRINPFRYQISIRNKYNTKRFTINKNGRFHINVSNFIYKVKKSINLVWWSTLTFLLSGWIAVNIFGRLLVGCLFMVIALIGCAILIRKGD